MLPTLAAACYGDERLCSLMAATVTPKHVALALGQEQQQQQQQQQQILTEQLPPEVQQQQQQQEATSAYLPDRYALESRFPSAVVMQVKLKGKTMENGACMYVSVCECVCPAAFTTTCWCNQACSNLVMVENRSFASGKLQPAVSSRFALCQLPVAPHRLQLPVRWYRIRTGSLDPQNFPLSSHVHASITL
eukprot:1160050-Pelagomonas_calceolata.AAC.12